MLTVTESAISNLKEYLDKNRIDSPIRVAMQSSCAGVGLGLALDSEKPEDRIFREGGLTFLVNEGVFASAGAITVDYVTKSSSGCGCGGGGGFTVTPEKKLAGGGCGGGSCSTGSCGC
ncbi:MAG: IscA/HesB family protein [Thermodesulfobacteriota bacterium]